MGWDNRSPRHKENEIIFERVLSSRGQSFELLSFSQKLTSGSRAELKLGARKTAKASAAAR
jgi:hypothetical protein